MDPKAASGCVCSLGSDNVVSQKSQIQFPPIYVRAAEHVAERTDGQSRSSLEKEQKYITVRVAFSLSLIFIELHNTKEQIKHKCFSLRRWQQLTLKALLCSQLPYGVHAFE